MSDEEKAKQIYCEYCANNGWDKCKETCSGYKVGVLKLQEMAEWKEQQFSEQNKWHKVANGDLPKDNEVYVLHTIYSGVFTGWYENGKWWKPGFSPYSDDEVIAWYKLPKYTEEE